MCRHLVLLNKLSVSLCYFDWCVQAYYSYSWTTFIAQLGGWVGLLLGIRKSIIYFVCTVNLPKSWIYLIVICMDLLDSFYVSWTYCIHTVKASQNGFLFAKKYQQERPEILINIFVNLNKKLGGKPKFSKTVKCWEAVLWSRSRWSQNYFENLKPEPVLINNYCTIVSVEASRKNKSYCSLYYHWDTFLMLLLL